MNACSPEGSDAHSRLVNQVHPLLVPTSHEEPRSLGRICLTPPFCEIDHFTHDPKQASVIILYYRHGPLGTLAFLVGRIARSTAPSRRSEQRLLICHSAHRERKSPGTHDYSGVSKNHVVCFLSIGDGSLSGFVWERKVGCVH